MIPDKIISLILEDLLHLKIRKTIKFVPKWIDSISSDTVFDKNYPSIFNLLKINGLAIHCNPCQGNMNHGFYNFQPTFYFSFYKSCGFTDLKAFLIESNEEISNKKYYITPIMNNFNNMQYYPKLKSSTYIMTIARKVVDSQFIIPNQEFYQKIFEEKSKTGLKRIVESKYKKILGDVPENDHKVITKTSYEI